MQCINDACESMDTKVVETNNTAKVTWRRRCCDACGTKYVTVEVMARDQAVPRKKRKNDVQAQ